jgi:hypothetical protein
MSDVIVMNATVPQPSSQVQVSLELRTLKLKINELCVQGNAQELALVPLLAAGVTGKALLASATVDAAKTALSFSPDMKTFTTAANTAAMQSFLGIAAAIVEVNDVGTGQGTITFPGGTKINWDLRSVAGGGGTQAVTWKNPFGTVVFGILTTVQGGDQAGWVASTTGLTGCQIDHNNASSKNMFTVALGI